MSDYDWNGSGHSDIGDDYIAYRIISDDDSGSGGSGGSGGRKPPGSGGAGCGTMLLTALILWLILRLIF